MKILIVGGGPAAHSAAFAARAAATEAEIVLCTKEPVAPYRRPALSRYVKEDLPDEQFLLDAPERYAALKIGLRLNTEIVSLSPADHTAATAEGGTIGYDRLILCTGSNGFIPPLENAAQFPPYLLRSYENCMTIRRAFQTCRSAVILGGGLLGLELADSLNAMGGKVTVIEAAERLLPKQLSEEQSACFLAVAKKSGVEFVLGDAPKRFLADGVELVSGTICRAGMVCAACGVRPELTLAQNAMIPCGKGITVDEHLKTGAEDVFAAGDCIELGGRLSGFFLPAMEMGEVAGANAAGEDRTFAFAPAMPLYWNGLGVQIADGTVNERLCSPQRQLL